MIDKEREYREREHYHHHHHAGDTALRTLDVIAAVLVIIGALVWGIVGVFNFNVVEYIFQHTWLDRLIYVLVGLSGLYQAIGWKSIQRRWRERYYDRYERDRFRDRDRTRPLE